MKAINWFVLFAGNNFHFWQTHKNIFMQRMNFNVYFTLANDKVEGFNLAQYGVTQAFNKIN